MPDNPNQLRDPVSGRYGHAIYRKDKVEIPSSGADSVVSKLARIGEGAYISKSRMGDSSVGSWTKIIHSNIGNYTVVGDNSFVFESDLTSSNEIGNDSSIIASKLDANRGHIELHDHVSISASEIGASVFANQYTTIQSSKIDRLCEFAGHSIIANAEIGEDSHFGELCNIQGAIIYRDARIGDNVTIMQDSVLMDSVAVGDRSYIGTQVELADHVIADRDVTIGAHSRIGRYTRIEDGVSVGVEAVIGEGVILRKGCIVEDGARVPAGTTVGSGETFYSRT